MQRSSQSRATAFPPQIDARLRAAVQSTRWKRLLPAPLIMTVGMLPMLLLLLSLLLLMLLMLLMLLLLLLLLSLLLLMLLMLLMLLLLLLLLLSLLLLMLLMLLLLMLLMLMLLPHVKCRQDFGAARIPAVRSGRLLLLARRFAREKAAGEADHCSFRMQRLRQSRKMMPPLLSMPTPPAGKQNASSPPTMKRTREPSAQFSACTRPSRALFTAPFIRNQMTGAIQSRSAARQVAFAITVTFAGNASQESAPPLRRRNWMQR
jgi:hypothetical protein